MSDDAVTYPKRGQYGPPLPRCQWCGRTFHRFWPNSRYCSSECSSAGNYPVSVAWGVCCTGLGVILVAVFAILASFTSPPPPSSFWLRVGQGSFQLLILMVVSFFLGTYFLWTARKGKTVRDANERSNEYVQAK